MLNDSKDRNGSVTGLYGFVSNWGSLSTFAATEVVAVRGESCPRDHARNVVEVGNPGFSVSRYACLDILQPVR